MLASSRSGPVRRLVQRAVRGAPSSSAAARPLSSSASAALASAAPGASPMPKTRAPLREAVTSIEKQQILAVAELALGDPEVVAMWFGESDVATPAFIGDAAAAALRAGDTFYTHKRGTTRLRDALKTYTDGLYGLDTDVERISVTHSGMSAIMLCLQCILNPGDNGVVINPVWPNAQSAIRALSGEPRFASLTASDGVWRLDLADVYKQCDARTKLVFVNTPCNPTGWTMRRDQMAELMAFCRERGIWLISDEVYHRLVFDGVAAPSFLEVARDDDPLLCVHSFSKSWAMTGWRIGWLVHPAAMGELVGNMIEFNYSCAPPFLQEAAAVALERGEPFVQEMVERCRRGRDVVSDALASMPRITDFTPPEASFYAFFRIQGEPHSLEFAQRLVTDAKIGLAPGTAFGPGAEDWYRLCFAIHHDRLEEAMSRFKRALA